MSRDGCRLALVAAGVVVAVALVGCSHRSRRRPIARARARPTTTAVAHLSGLALVGDEGGINIVDLRTGTSRKLGLAELAGTRVTRILARSAKYVVMGNPGQPNKETLTPGPVFALDAALDGRAVRLGEATDVLPSVQPDRAWLVTQRLAGQIEGDSDLQEVDLTGRPAGAVRHLGCCRRPLAEVDGGFVTEAGGIDEPFAVEVDNPTTGRAVRQLSPNGHLVAARSDLVAWVANDCGSACALHLTDLHTGHDATVAVPGTTPSTSGVFSSDGTELAFGTGPPGDMVVLDLSRLTIAVVPDSERSENAAGSVSWSPEPGRVFFLRQDETAGGNLWTYRLGDAHAQATGVTARPPFIAVS